MKEIIDDRPLLIGESNPYGGDLHFALYPAPDGCSGHRLCCLILGMTRKDYLASFQRVNLCEGKWLQSRATERSTELIHYYPLAPFILLGAKVSRAFGEDYEPFKIHRDNSYLILPHPSGLNRLWNEPDAIKKARKAVVKFDPRLADVIGRNERKKR